MSLFLDQKYLSLISNRLPLFKKKKDNTYNCRCIICGDSMKKASKARGYFFPNKDKLQYKDGQDQRAGLRPGRRPTGCKR